MLPIRHDGCRRRFADFTATTDGAHQEQHSVRYASQHVPGLADGTEQRDNHRLDQTYRLQIARVTLCGRSRDGVERSPM